MSNRIAPHAAGPNETAEITPAAVEAALVRARAVRARAVRSVAQSIGRRVASALRQPNAGSSRPAAVIGSTSTLMPA